MVEENGGTGNETIQIWDYETRFREYALLLGRKGPEALESITNYPKRIDIGNVWHGALDRMRSETRGDGSERYALITYDENAREFHFPEISVKGEPKRVPGEAIVQEIKAAKEDRKVKSIVGEIHTHPVDYPFSPPDLFRLLYKPIEYRKLIVGITTPTENIFAFRTRETFLVTEQDMPGKLFSSVFTDHWLEKAGYKYSEDRSHVIRTDPSANLWEANIGIAETHRLALYKGKPGGELIRAYP